MALDCTSIIFTARLVEIAAIANSIQTTVMLLQTTAAFAAAIIQAVLRLQSVVKVTRWSQNSVKIKYAGIGNRGVLEKARLADQIGQVQMPL